MLSKEEGRRLKKGGGKKRTHSGKDGGEGGAEKKRRGGEEGPKSQGDGGKKRLDALSVGYFRRVGERLGEGFEDDEEREMFVENVLMEVKGKASVVATDQTGSITLQRLLLLSSPDQVGGVLAELGGESGSELKAVSCDRCGGHVVESALRQASRWMESSQRDPSSTTEEEEEEDSSGVLEAQVLSLSQVVRDNSSEFIGHVYGSHVVRTLLHVLAGCIGPPRTEARAGAKERNIAPQLTDFEIPTSFWYELKSLTETLMENINLSVTDAVASAVFQTMLTVSHRKRPKLCKQLLRRTMEYLTSRSAAPGVSPLLVFLKDQASSRLIETVIQLSPKSLLCDLYKNHLKGHVVNLALHPIANFPIQRLTAALAKYKLFPRFFDELVQGVEAILAAGHMGVIVQLAESCAESGEKQDEMMQCLLCAFHCAEPGSRHDTCLPLFMSLLTYDVYYHSDTAEGAVNTEVPLTSICYHGSRLVQALAKFKERSLLLSSLRTLSPADLLRMASDSAGSHVLQALITTSSDKGRGKILKRLEGQYVQMACSRVGSRVLEATWNCASVSQRQNIAQELVPSESQLRSDQFARHVWAKFALSHFVLRRAHWQEIQTGESKKRKLFSDILE
ncbi:nucleolar protein 9 [Leuresthes tenuis]|uniref:nucleolar protein 9 n=1 Tax=Leuresthes tenuis TaxID=355514 RepID=UPI003B511452